MVPRLSVVIPCYNGRSYLVECLRSVSRVVDDGLRIPVDAVVVDDGSTEDIRGVVDTFMPAVRYVRQANQGPAAARNRGVSETAGEFVWFLDSDDYLLQPDILAQQLRVLDKHPEVGLVHARALAIDDRRRPFGLEGPPFARGNYLHRSEDELAKLLFGNYVTTSTVVARRAVLDRVGPWRTDLVGPEDWDYWLRVARVSSVAYVHAPLVAYRIHGGSVTSRYTPFEWLRMHQEILSRFFADPEIERRFAGMRPAIEAKECLGVAEIAYLRPEMPTARAYARQALRRAVSCRQRPTAIAAAWLLTKSFAPGAVREAARPLSRRLRGLLFDYASPLLQGR